MTSNDRHTTYIATGLFAFAVLVTLWRLVYRYRSPYGIRWGDGWAAVAMINCIVYDIGLWASGAPPGAKGVSQTFRIASIYYDEVCFTFTIWAVRLSILCTIIHISPPKFRRLLLLIGGVFIVFALVLVAQKFWVCVPEKGWREVPGQLCELGNQVAILEIVTDVIGDAVLCIIPLIFFGNMQSRRSLRIRLSAIFSMSFLTTVISLWQCYYLIHPNNGKIDILASDLELFVALTVCNLGVLVAAFYKQRRNTDLENGLSRDRSRSGSCSAHRSGHLDLSPTGKPTSGPLAYKPPIQWMQWDGMVREDEPPEPPFHSVFTHRGGVDGCNERFSGFSEIPRSGEPESAKRLHFAPQDVVLITTPEPVARRER